MQIEMLRQPSTHRRRHGILNPAAHRLASQCANARNVNTFTVKVLLRVFPIDLTLVPKRIQITHFFLQMVSHIGWPITQLRIQVVMIITLPWWKFPIVGSPYSLERDWRRVFTGSRTKLVHFIVVLLLQDRIGYGNGRGLPIVVPIVHVVSVVRVHTTLQGLEGFFRSLVGRQ